MCVFKKKKKKGGGGNWISGWQKTSKKDVIENRPHDGSSKIGA